MEQRRRSIARTISWRATATITTIGISYLITGTVDTAVKIGFVELSAKLFLQYFHERLWTNIKFGLEPRHTDYQI